MTHHEFTASDRGVERLLAAIGQAAGGEDLDKPLGTFGYTVHGLLSMPDPVVPRYGAQCEELPRRKRLSADHCTITVTLAPDKCLVPFQGSGHWQGQPGVELR